MDRCLTNIKPPPHTPRRIGSERRPQGQSLHRGPAGTTPSRRSSPPSFPSPSTPTRSAHTCTAKRKNGSTPTWPGVLILPSRFSPIIRLLWQCDQKRYVSKRNTYVSTDWLPFAKLNTSQILAKWGKINCSNFSASKSNLPASALLSTGSPVCTV